MITRERITDLREGQPVRRPLVTELALNDPTAPPAIRKQAEKVQALADARSKEKAQLDKAKGKLAQAETADAQAYADAVKANGPDAKDPGTRHAAEIHAAIDAHERKLGALKEGLHRAGADLGGMVRGEQGEQWIAKLEADLTKQARRWDEIENELLGLGMSLAKRLNDLGWLRQGGSNDTRRQTGGVQFDPSGLTRMTNTIAAMLPQEADRDAA